MGYPVSGDLTSWDKTTEASLRRYEARRKLPVTGNPLSYETQNKMVEDIVVLDTEQVTLASSRISLTFWNRFVSAQGTWTLKGEPAASRRQATTIECSRQTNRCIEANATLDRFFGPHLSATIETYEIERWDEHEIITAPLEFGCVRYVKRINRAQSSVTGIRSRINADRQECKILDQDEKHLLLSDGVQVSTAALQQMEIAKRSILSPEAVKALDKWLTPTKEERGSTGK